MTKHLNFCEQLSNVSSSRDVSHNSETRLAGGTVHAQVIGKGPNLVLLHSLLADRSSYQRITGPLAERFRVVLPDLPGFPESEPLPGPLDAIANRMARAIEDVAAGAPVMLLGNGYGGFIALALTIRRPQLVSRLVLSNSGAVFPEAGREKFRVMARLAELQGLEAIAEMAMRRLFAPKFYADNPTVVAERRDRFLAMDKRVFIAACHVLAELDLRPQLAQLSVPLLAIAGERDEATPPAMSQELISAVRYARLIVLPECAHVPQLQAPEQFLEAVMPFLHET